MSGCGTAQVGNLSLHPEGIETLFQNTFYILI
jgi:hypothetical protein